MCNAAAQAPRDGQWVALLKHATGVIADHEAAAGAPILFLPFRCVSCAVSLCPVSRDVVSARRPLPLTHACTQEGPSKACRRLAASPLVLLIAARHVRTIAHAIDGARYDLHGFGGGSPGESGGQAGRRAVAQAGQGKGKGTANFRAACGLSIAGPKI